VVRAADSGNSDGLLNHTVMALGEFRPARGAAAYTSVDSVGLDNIIAGVIKNGAADWDIITIDYIAGTAAILVQISTGATGAYNHDVIGIALLHNPTVAGTSYASGILVVLLNVDISSATGEHIPVVKAFNMADGTGVTALDYLGGHQSTVDSDSASGQKVLNIASTTDFSAGKYVIVGYGTAREEVLAIDTVQAGVSITLTTNLGFTHTAAQADTVVQAHQSTPRVFSISPLSQHFSGYVATYQALATGGTIAAIKRENITATTATATHGQYTSCISPVSKAARPLIYLGFSSSLPGDSQLELYGESIDKSISAGGTGALSLLNEKEFVAADWSTWTGRPDTVLHIQQLPIVSPEAAVYGNAVALMGDYQGTPIAPHQISKPRLALLSGPTQSTTPHEVLLSHADHATYLAHGFALSGDGYVYVCATGEFITDSDSADSDKILIFKVAAWDFSTILASFRHRVEVDGTTDSNEGLGGDYAYGSVASTRITNAAWDGHRLIVYDEGANRLRRWVFDKDLNAISVATLSSAAQPVYPRGSFFVSPWYGKVY